MLPVLCWPLGPDQALLALELLLGPGWWPWTRLLSAWLALSVGQGPSSLFLECPMTLKRCSSALRIVLHTQRVFEEGSLCMAPGLNGSETVHEACTLPDGPVGEEHFACLGGALGLCLGQGAQV